MEGAMEVTVLRHEVLAEEERDHVTESNLFFLTTKSDYNNPSTVTAYNGTDSSMRNIMTVFVYALPVIILAGTVGNILSFLVLVRCQMRNTSVYFYLLALAVADTCVLYVSAFNTWLRVVFGYQLQHESDAVCKSVTFILLVSWHLSAWLIVFVTVDRFVVVWFPFKASSVCTVTRSRIATAVLVLTNIVYNSHVFWTYNLYYSQQNRGLICGPSEGYPKDHFMFHGFEYLKLATYSLIPFAIILVLNAAIITRLQWRPFLLRGRSSGDTSSTRSESSIHGRQAKVTYMLVAVSFAWLILTLPFSVHAFIFNARYYYPQQTVVRAVSFLLIYTNHAINFYIYCITGKKFRRELEDLSKSTCTRMKRQTNGGGGGGGGSTVCSPSRKTHGPRTNLVDIELHELVNT